MDSTGRRLPLFAIAALIAAMALASTLQAAVDSPPSALAKKQSKCAKAKEKQGCVLPVGAKFDGSGPNGRVVVTVSKEGTDVEVSGTVKCGSNPNPFPLTGLGTTTDKPKVGSTLDIEGVNSQRYDGEGRPDGRRFPRGGLPGEGQGTPAQEVVRGRRAAPYSPSWEATRIVE
jgi:hypothetical protein